MKKLLAILAVAGVMTACNNSGETPAANADTANKAAETTAPATDTSKHDAADTSKGVMDKVKEGADKDRKSVV